MDPLHLYLQESVALTRGFVLINAEILNVLMSFAQMVTLPLSQREDVAHLVNCAQ